MKYKNELKISGEGMFNDIPFYIEKNASINF